VFERIARAAWRTGDPGLIFIDRINRSPANPVPAVGLVEATNPCVAGDCLVPTDRGLLRMDQLASRYRGGGVAVQVDSRLLPPRLMVWEGTHDTPLSSYLVGCLPISQAFCSGERPTVTVRTKAGFELTCTPDHRLMTDRGWVEAGDLRVSEDRVWIQSDPGVFGADGALRVPVAREFRGRNGRRYHHSLPVVWSRELGVVLGWLVGDGWLRSGDRNCRVGFSFGPDDDALLERLRAVLNGWYGRDIGAVERTRGVRHLSYHGKFFVAFFESLGVKPVPAERKVVPESLFAAPREAVVGFLQGLFTADGTVRENPKRNSGWIALTSKSRELLRGTQLLLLNLGIRSVMLDRSRPPRSNVFAYRTSAGEARVYGSDGVLFELGVHGKSRELFHREVGFLNRKQERLGRIRYSGFYAQKFSDPVVAVEPAGIRRVYDLTEPQSHSMVANGLVIHQCGEQPLLPWEACNLGSINVARFAKERDTERTEVDWDELERVARLAVRFLDDVIEVNPYPLPQIDAVVKANRRIGLGVMGWADLLFELGIPYDSQEALDLAERLMSFLREKGRDQSARLAEERGPFPNWSRSIYRDGRPLRNSTVTTIAPTGTISMIAGCSSGIEPAFALAFEHRVTSAEAERVLTFVSETFERLAKARGFHSEPLMAEVVRHGSLHGVSGVPEEARALFKTAHEIDHAWHVKHQAAFQKHTDNGVSKTINLPRAATEDDVAAAYRLAWELGCLGITVFRDGSKESQVLHMGVSDETAGAIGRGVKPRPHSLRGTTYRMETPIGTAFITVNDSPAGDPFEVFVQVGKAGSDTMAVAEALGRLVSLVLRLPSPLPAQRRLEEVINQLARIGGGQPTGFGAAKILSLPDALARTMAEHIGQSPQGRDASAAEDGVRLRPVGDLCKECGQATFIYEEGCKKCLSCGFNQC
jgi:ribonucleoside-diphosphate reductase alpha chain